MRNLFRLAWKMISNQKLISLITIFGIVASAAISISILSVFNSMDATAKIMNQDLYGEFSDVAYNVDVDQNSFPAEDSERVAESFLKGKKVYDAAAISVSAFAISESEKFIPFGYMDSHAQKLSHIKMKQGAMPQKDNEIAVEASVLYHLGLEEKIGQEIKFEIRTRDGAKEQIFVLSGIVSNYSSLWVKSNALAPIDQLLVSCFTTKNEAAQLSELTGIKQTHLLMKAAKDTFSATEYNAGNVVSNNLLKNVQETSRTSVPYAILVITLLCSVLVISSILEYSLQKQKKRWALLRLIGMNKKNTVLLLVIVLSILLLIALPIGILGGVGFAKAMILLIERITQTKYSFVISPVQLLISSLFSILAVASAGILPCYRIIKIAPLQNFNGSDRFSYKSAQKRQTYDKKITLSKMVKYSNQNSTKKWLPILLIAMFVVLFNFFSVYLSAFSSRYIVSEADGFYTADYDFQFSTGDPLADSGNAKDDNDGVSSPLPKDDSVILWNDSSNMGCSQNMLDKIKGNPIFLDVKAYKDIHTLKLILPKSEFSQYLDFRDGTTNDGTASTEDNYSPQIRNAFGYQESDMLIGTQINGYSLKELNEFKPYVAKGVINIDKIKSGEEVILMLPSYYVERSEDGGSNLFFAQEAPFGQELYQDTSFQVGDVLNLTKLEAEKPLKSGYINLQTAESCLRRADKTVRVGAIIYQRVGRFSTLISPPSPITLLTLNESFDKIGFSNTYARIHMYINNPNDYRSIENEVKSYGSELPNMNYENRISEMENYRSNKFLIQFSSNVFLAFLALISFVILSTQNINKVLSNERKYALLRINGMTIPKLVKMFLIDNLHSCTLAVFLAIVVGAPSIGFTFFGFSGLLSFKTFIALCVSIVFVYIVSALSVIPIIPVFKKKSIADILRND